MLFYTNQSRQSESILKEQRAKMRDRLDELRELKRMAHLGRNLLESGDFDAFGLLMDEAWKLKKMLAPSISNDVIDDIYSTAKNAGAFGGR
jgi:D-glycero-alpha-D-manno-heptose-7-phosphate kinase